ncbi:MAG: HAD family hydrolase [Desertimonas sp.]
MPTARFDAVWFDAGGVLVLPDPTVLGPLLAFYDADPSVPAHRRAHYGAMAVKSARGADESDWAVYNETYCRWLGVPEADVAEAADVLDRTRHAPLWRWPIPETAEALARLHDRDVPIGVVSNAAGQIEAVLARAGVCQVGAGHGVPVRCVIDSTVVGVAKPDPAIFDYAAPFFAGIDRARIAYVGDSVTMDVAGAAAAGLHPLLLDPHGDHPDAAFETITAVADVLAWVS